MARSTSLRAAMPSASPVAAFSCRAARVYSATCSDESTSPKSPSEATTTARSSGPRAKTDTSGSAVTTCALAASCVQSLPAATLSRKLPNARVIGKSCSPTRTLPGSFEAPARSTRSASSAQIDLSATWSWVRASNERVAPSFLTRMARQSPACATVKWFGVTTSATAAAPACDSFALRPGEAAQERNEASVRRKASCSAGTRSGKWCDPTRLTWSRSAQCSAAAEPPCPSRTAKKPCEGAKPPLARSSLHTVLSSIEDLGPCVWCMPYRRRSSLTSGQQMGWPEMGVPKPTLASRLGGMTLAMSSGGVCSARVGE
mmetsp:Transcript_34101/g.112902  ORF Transcript_34101/g.112902 Transcript_34101/m.112902 type:complete len:316 (+) Transcript_34101:637-1584(+)